MQNYSVNYPSQTTMRQQQPTYAQAQVQTQTVPAQQTVVPPQSQPVNVQAAGATGATFNIGTNTPGSIPVGASGVTINILGATVTPNGANINNTYNTSQPAQTYGKDYYTMNHPQVMPQVPTVPAAATQISQQQNDKNAAKKDIVLLTDEYIKTLENYLRNDNPDIKLMGAKELMNRFREDSSRKNDPALTALLNLTLQSKYSNVKMIGMGILQNGWAQGDALTQQLLAQAQQSNSGYGLDALDAAKAALKSAGQTVQVVDPNPPKAKSDKK